MLTNTNDNNVQSGKTELKCTEEKTPGCYLKARHALAFMGFLASVNLYLLRANLSVAIVAMVNSTKENIENASDICPGPDAGRSSDATTNAIFSWNSAQQGLVLGCYFYGYVISNIPNAWLAKRIGIKLSLGIFMFISSIITFCLPAAAYASFELFVALRILLGAFQGIVSPAIQGAWSLWAPPLERSILVAIAFSGSSFGTCVVFPLAGLIADRLGWEAVFYVTGGIAAIWSIIWLVIIHNSPDEHPRISEQEKNYIMRSIGLVEKKKNTPGKVRTPWLSMFTSLPLLSIVFGHFASNWGNYTLMTMLPTYLATILKFDISASGAIAAVPYLLHWVFSVVAGSVTDFIRKAKLISTTTMRKFNTFLGLGIPALFIILAGYIGCNATAAIAFFSLSVGFNGFIIPGCLAATIDIAPKYAGISFGISNAIANIAGFLAPQLVGIILLDGNNLGQWKMVFWLSAGFHLAGALVYLIFGSSEEQTWSEGKVIKILGVFWDFCIENQKIVLFE